MTNESARLGTRKMFWAGAALCLLGIHSGSAQGQGVAGTAEQAADAKEWPTYGHDSGGMRFSPLTQINPSNVAGLTAAWTYHMKQDGDAVRSGFGGGPPGGRRPGGVPPGGGPPGGLDSVSAQAAAEGIGPPRVATGFSVSEVTPLVVHGVMYIGTPYGRVTALDPTTGKELWNYKLASGEPATRGVEYFPGDKVSPPLIVVGTSDAKLFTLDPKTGALNTAFGVNGFVDLNTPEITHGLEGATDGLSSPPIMYENMIIVGGRTTESGGPGPAGDVRAFDIHTGKLAWTFHSIPQPGEPNYGGWVGDSAKYRSGVNVWGLITVDAKRGIAYLPFGAP